MPDLGKEISSWWFKNFPPNCRHWNSVEDIVEKHWTAGRSDIKYRNSFNIL